MNTVKIDRLKTIANKVFDVDVVSKNRQTDCIEARATCYSIMREELHMTFADIAKHFNKNHATVLHAVNEFPYMIKYNPELAQKHKLCKEMFIKKEDMFGDSSDIVETVLIKKSLNKLQESNILLSLAVTKLQKEMEYLKNKFNYRTR